MTAWVSGPLGEFEHPGGGEGLLAGCILFLVVAGSGLLLAMRRRRQMLEDGRSAARGWVGQTRWATPLPGVPRLELCVIRV